MKVWLRFPILVPDGTDPARVVDVANSALDDDDGRLCQWGEWSPGPAELADSRSDPRLPRTGTEEAAVNDIEIGTSRSLNEVGRDTCQAALAARDKGAHACLTSAGQPVAAIVPLLPGAMADEQVEAVMDVLAPFIPGIPGVVGPVRYPLILFQHDGQTVMPSDDQVRMLAEQIVTRLRTAGGGS